MTIYYQPEWLVDGRPTFDKCPEPPVEVQLDDEGCYGPQAMFHDDTWYITLTSFGPPSIEGGINGIKTVVLASYPANQFHQVGRYFQAFAQTMYNWSCQQIRPNQSGGFDIHMQPQHDADA